MRPDPAAATGLDELSVLALTLFHESASEGLRGMLAVGAVIRNRAAWGRWSSTIRGNCLAFKQFSCWRPQGGPKNYDNLVKHAAMLRRGERPHAMAAAFSCAEAVIAGLHDDETKGADHYYSPSAMAPPGRIPAWAVGVRPTAFIGRHVFFRLRPGGAPAGVTTET